MYGEDWMMDKERIHELEDKNLKQEKMIDAIKKQYDYILSTKDKEIEELKTKLKSMETRT